MKKILRFAAIFTSIALYITSIFLINQPPPPPPHEVFRMSLEREDFLEDIDYLIGIINENFPYSHLLYQQHGVDIQALGQTLKANAADRSKEIDYHSFKELLYNEFFSHIQGVGQLSLLNAQDWHYYTRALSLPPHSIFDSVMLSMLIHNTSRLSYGPIDDAIEEYVAQRIQGEGNITTEIIEDGNIAYLKVYRMPYLINMEDALAVFSLYGQIGDFGHLIIDLRGNSGEWGLYFEELIAGPLTPTGISAEFTYHYKAGGHNLGYIENLRAANFGIGSINPASKDFSQFDFYFTLPHTIQPSSYQSNFNGKIWLLVDEFTQSFAAKAANIFMQNNFATVVGETTGGSIGNPFGRNFVVLPNTGIIFGYSPTYVIDVNGNTLEEGVSPHYFNKEGRDALDTVLDLINENVG